MKENKSITDITNKVVLGTLLFCFTGLVSLAADVASNFLTGVEIKNSDNGYAIVLKADQPAQVRKTVESPDDIYLDVAGMVPSESVGTIYNDVPNVDNVIIQATDSNGTRILLHGKNIAACNVGFEAASAAAQNLAVDGEQKQAISLNAPVSTYAPVYNQDNNLQEEESGSLVSTMGSLAVSTAQGSLPILKRIIKYVLRLDRKYLAFGGLFLLIMLIGLKAVKPNKESEMKIGLSQSLKDRELDMRDELSLNDGVRTLRSRSQGVEASAPSINYGIKAYQNSQKNPYTSQLTGLPMRKTNPVAPSYKNAPAYSQPVNNTQLNSVQRPMPRKRTPMPAAASAPGQSSMATNTVKSVDSMKFLESMAQIYEKNGRKDLATELKANIQKVQVAR